MEGEQRPETAQKPPGLWGERYTFALMCFFALMCQYGIRYSLPIGIVAMANRTDASDNSGDILVRNGEYDWDTETQGLILGAFYYGYAAAQLPSGIYANKMPAKWTFALSIGGSSLITVLYPWVADAGSGVFIAVRAIQGIVEGPVYSLFFRMVTKWFPGPEKANLTTLVFLGSTVGSVFSFGVGGLIADTIGWEYIFYVLGGMGMLWAVAWILIIHETPAKNPRMSKAELEYLAATTESSFDEDSNGSSDKFPPLKAIATSVPFIALVVTHFANDWGFYVLGTGIPQYLNDVHGLSLDENGLLSALPNICLGFVQLPIGYISDRMTGSGLVSRTAVRKIFQSLGVYIPAAALLWMCFVGDNTTQAVAAMCIAVGINGLTYMGFYLSFSDLSPNYAGSLFGISNTFTNIGGFIVPWVTGIIISEESTVATWRIVFLNTVAMYLVSGIVFQLFVTAKVQKWDKQ